MYRKSISITLLNSSNRNQFGSVSCIRGSAPDYVLTHHGYTEIKGVSAHIGDDIVEVVYGEQSEYLLNWGDLFLCALEAHQIKNFELKTAKLKFYNLSQENYKKEDALVTKALKEKKLNANELSKVTAERKYQYSMYLFCDIFESYMDSLEEGAYGAFAYEMQGLLCNGDEWVSFNDEKNITQRYLKALSLHKINDVDMHFSPDTGGMEFSFNQVKDAISLDINSMLQEGLIVKQCENCGKYFIPAARNDEKYCYFPYGEIATTPRKRKTCRDVGYSNKVEHDIVMKTYRKIYKTQNARKQRNRKNVANIEDKFNTWSVYAKEQLDLCRKGNISVSDFELLISNNTWLGAGAPNAEE